MELKTLVDYGVMGILGGLSVWVVAVALQRGAYLRKVRVDDFTSRGELETELTRGLTLIGTVAANAPYVGLLGTVLGIMLTFQTLGATGEVDVKSIMTGLALALKATAMGLLVAIPCVGLNNYLRRRVRERLAEFDARTGRV
ncbi:MAG TPA: TonB-system energizer ExbB [Thiobacillaceae bacterium]|nr:TonB-system energizer ExbB [Thiobacillaceae bacterium]